MFWRNYTDLIKALGYSVTLWIACYNLKRFIDIETVKALGDLREKLNSTEKKKIHSYLIKEEKCILPIETNDCAISPNIELFDYFGTLELGALMENKEVISFDEFYRQFGYRIKKVAKNEKTRPYLESKPESYKVLKEMVNKFIEKGKLDAKYKF